MTKEQLASLAKDAMERAYSPYSNYKVGAALLCKDGSVYTGCNVENASFSATNCAERTAFFKAVSEGKREFSAIAICGGKGGVLEGLFPPCGVCRQVMREFCDDNFEIHLLAKEGIETYTLGELLPVSFAPQTIKKTEK
jgi:cytidine deaminase